MLHQGDGLDPAAAGLALAGVIGLEQLHQGGCQLLGCPPGPLLLEGMPVAIADGQQSLQTHRLLGGPGRPAPFTVPLAARARIQVAGVMGGAGR